MTGPVFIAVRSLKCNALSTFITSFSIALACGLMMAVYAFKEQARDAFIMKDLGYDAVVGAKGSQLQLVLNSIYHLEQSPGNISWEIYTTLKKNPMVKTAIPMAVGDNYYGYRIVGTNIKYSNKSFITVFRFLSTLREVVRSGLKSFTNSSQVFSNTKSNIGVTYFITCTQCGIYNSTIYFCYFILENTNTPNDRVIWIPINSFFRMDGHVLRGSGDDFEAASQKEIPDEHKEVSAVLVEFRSPFMAQRIAAQINRGNQATIAYPVATVSREAANSQMRNPG